jgi:hypothetical protein
MRFTTFFLILCSGFLVMAWQMLRPDTSLPPVQTESGFAVVELFTSEGCSSCPPADRLLTQLAQNAGEENAPIFALSFHVDYWNYLGWADSYSDLAYSAPQRNYSQALSEGVYTPQMIVNGTYAFVGSNASKAQQALRSVLAEPASVTLSLQVQRLSAHLLEATYQAENFPADAVVHIALVERGLAQDVTRGENTGRTLTHENVVRAFKTLTADTQTATLTLPDDFAPQNTAIIVYAQHPRTKAILGATRLDVPMQ